MALGHLARRFVGSLRPGGPSKRDVRWVEGQLRPGELALWSAMPGPDRRHSVGVARRVTAALGARATRPVVAAALLHDVGKTQVGLRTPGRVLATAVAAGLGRRRAAAWAEAGGYRGRLGRYACHDELGAQLLAASGSDAMTVAWAREHHLPPERWTLPPQVATALKSADDD